MIRLLIANQRGGVGKTTTTVNLMRYLSDQGKRVLLIDTDPQGSVGEVLGLKHKNSLASFVAHRFALAECLVPYNERVNVLCSGRDTLSAESALLGAQARELVLWQILKSEELAYDAVLIDSAPSISILQSAAMYYTKQILVPVDMDSLSLTGTWATHGAITLLNEYLHAGARIVGLLPTRVDRRYQMTQTVLAGLQALATQVGAPILPEIRTDASVGKSLRARKPLAEFAPESKVWADYQAAFRKLLEALGGEEIAAA
jgi:chromosome partitioning protein